ncbi:hypothetical protein [Geobacillus sp. LEMMY01]|uniref:hypothetical protein n=1 Tax=Geobacillus sp. LEMMY01 TaxID=1954237 RepID=UPI0020CA383C|nr:hypothetical protein [Geobacillus sp. LEMMY01]
MKGKFKKFLVASSFVTLLSGFNLVNYAFADSKVVNNESKEVKEVLEQKEKLKQSVNIDKYDLVRKSELGVKEGYDKDDPEPDWAPGDSFGSPKGTNNISFAAFAPGDIIVTRGAS